MKKLLLLFALIITQNSFCLDLCEIEDLNVVAKGENVTQCDEWATKIQSAKCEFTEAWYGSTIGMLSGCSQNAMVKTLDKRLLSLKSDNKKQFESEMEIQKEFNEAVKKSCTPSSDGGREARRMGWICEDLMYRYRAQQAEQINSNKLSLRSGRTKDSLLKKFKKFADDLCKMPASVWLDKHAPSDCTDKVLYEIDQDVFHRDFDEQFDRKKSGKGWESLL